ncbi:MAG: hypothetical protein AABX32_01970, partial [Nanoarchaeota archaeon]
NLRELKDIYDRLAEDLKNFDKIYGEFLSVLKGRGQQDFARLEGLPQVFQEFSRNSSLLDQLTRSAVQMTHSINPYIVEIQDQENIVESSSIELKLTIKRVENVAGERFKLELIRSNYRDSQEKLDQEFVTLKSILSKLKEAKAVYDALIKTVQATCTQLDTFLHSSNGKFVHVGANDIYLAVFMHEQYYFPLDLYTDSYIKAQINEGEKEPQVKDRFLREYSDFLGGFNRLLAEYQYAYGELHKAFNEQIFILRPYYAQRLDSMKKTLDKLSEIAHKCATQVERIRLNKYED